MPEVPDEEPQEAQFRRLPGAPEPPWPPEMQLLARRVRERQEAAVDLYETLEERPPWADVIPDLAAVGTPAPEFTRQLLGIGFEEQTSWRRDYKTTEIYADFAPDPSQGAMWAERAFGVTTDGAPEAAPRPGL